MRGRLEPGSGNLKAEDSSVCEPSSGAGPPGSGAEMEFTGLVGVWMGQIPA